MIALVLVNNKNAMDIFNSFIFVGLHTIYL